ncbi:hypothetical protein J4226_01040 [Candidatus Pacearchaeota archaeon]|nr:hypothetical protein [Candidatus Pacearchaeota archaeon]
MKISNVAEKRMGLYNLVFNASPLEEPCSNTNLINILDKIDCVYAIVFARDISSAILTTRDPLSQKDRQKILFSHGVYIVNDIPLY